MNNFDDADFNLVGVNDSNNVPSQQHLEPDPLVGNHYDPAIESNPTMNNFDDADFDLVGVNDSNNVPSQQHLEPDPLVGNHYDPAIESNPTMNNFDDADFDLDGVNLTELLNFDDTNLSDLSTFIDDSNNVPSQQHLEPDPLVGNHVLAGYDRAIELVPNIHFEHYAPTEAEFQELMRAAALAREGASESIIHHLQPRKRARKRARVPPVVQLPPPPPQEPNAQPQEPNSQAHEPNAQAHPQAHPQAQAHPQVPNALSQEIFIATIAQAVENLLQPQLVAIEESQVRFEENQTKLAEKLDEISNFLNNHLNE